MTIINKKEINALAEIHDAFCISIFIPTHRSGVEVLKGKDSIELKNHIKNLKNELQQQGMDDPGIEKIVQPVEELIGDRLFWSHQSDGLAIFLAPGFFKYYTVPVKFESYHYLSNSFYLKPLMPLLTGDGLFFLLALQMDNIQLYQASRYSITSVKIEDLIPTELEESTGYDFRQKNLQFHGKGGGNTVFHGHGAGIDDQDMELKKYLRDVNKGLMEILHDEYLPMLLAGQSHIVSMYREINTYPHLMKKDISKNAPDDAVLLHELAWEIMQPYFDKERKEKMKLYQEYISENKASADNEMIMHAALSGRVDTLFLENLEDLWGTYDPAINKLKITESQKKPNVSLMNLAAVSVLKNDGNVFLLDKEEMPEPAAKMNALFRY